MGGQGSQNFRGRNFGDDLEPGGGGIAGMMSGLPPGMPPGMMRGPGMPPGMNSMNGMNGNAMYSGMNPYMRPPQELDSVQSSMPAPQQWQGIGPRQQPDTAVRSGPIALPAPSATRRLAPWRSRDTTQPVTQPMMQTPVYDPATSGIALRRR